jgi:hypothetical protein
LQPAAGRAVPVTAASTAPLRSHSPVWSWSSTASSSSTGASAAKAASAGANQVARLSAFTATGSATRGHAVGRAAPAACLCRSCSSSRTRSTCWHRRRPASVARQGWPRTTSAQPSAFLQLPHPLRHRRRRDVQRARGALEAAFAHHGGQGGEGGIVQHAIQFCFIGLGETVCLHRSRAGKLAPMT